MTTPTPCPKADVLATEAEMLNGREVFHGVPIVETGDDGEGGLVAFGHHEPRRVLAALLAYCRSRGMDLSDLDITNPAAPHAPQLVERAAKWAVFYRHAGAELTEQDWHEDGWCTCTEYTWWADQAEETTPGATAVMWWNF